MVLCLIKVVYKYISFTFPVFIIGMVGIRRLLERFFTEEELDEVIAVFDCLLRKETCFVSIIRLCEVRKFCLRFHI